MDRAMKIPTNPMYDIDEFGVVRLISSGQIVPEYLNHKKKRAVKIRGKSHKVASHSLDRLMLNTYKTLPSDVDPEWMSVRFLDGNIDNISIANLEWDDSWWIPDPSIWMDYRRTGWVTAYGYLKVQLRVHDDMVFVRCSETYKEIGPKTGAGGYQFISVPGVYRPVRFHRLIALTFLKHPVDTDHLTVNHKDSKIINNNPSNLEWATYTQNNFHAFNEGPRSETVRKIRLKDLDTCEEITVAGIQEMARYLGVLPQAAHQALERRTFEGRPYKGHVFKYDDDTRTWEELAHSGPRKNSVVPDKIACKNLTSGEVKIYTSMRQMENDFGIRGFMIRRLLNSDVMVPWRGMCIQAFVEGDKLKWPDYPSEIIKVYSTTHTSDKPISVLDSNGNIEYYTNVTSWCMEDRGNRCDPAVLCRYMKKNKSKIFRWRDWVFSFIDLSKYQVK